MAIPQTGDAAPSFELQDQQGRSVKLADFAGKNVVLYFYPKDDTPGCTVEACAFRDEHSALERAGAVVLGVSPDDAASHQKFTAKFSLPFPLLVDTDHKTADAYGVWGEKQFAGRTYMGVIRSTFLIGPDGKLARVWPKVKVEGHVDEVLQALGLTPSAPKAAPAKPAATAASAPKRAPAAKSAAAKRAPAAKKGAAKKGAAAKKGPAAKKGAAKKGAAAKKSTAKKGATAKKGTAAKKAPAKKGAAARKSVAKKAPAAKRSAAAKKTALRPTLVGRARAIAERLLPRRR